MKVIQGLDNQDQEEDQVSAECIEMEEEQGVDEIKAKMAEDGMLIGEEDEVFGPEKKLNGHHLKNGVEKPEAVSENGVGDNKIETDVNQLVSENSDLKSAEVLSDEESNLPVEDDAEEVVSDDDTVKSSDKESSALAYETATTGATSPSSLGDTFDTSNDDQTDTTESSKLTEDAKERTTSEDLMNDLEKLTENEEVDNQGLVDGGDEAELEQRPSETSQSGLLQPECNQDKSTFNKDTEETSASSNVNENNSTSNTDTEDINTSNNDTEETSNSNDKTENTITSNNVSDVTNTSNNVSEDTSTSINLSEDTTNSHIEVIPTPNDEDGNSTVQEDHKEISQIKEMSANIDHKSPVMDIKEEDEVEDEQEVKMECEVSSIVKSEKSDSIRVEKPTEKSSETGKEPVSINENENVLDSSAKEASKEKLPESSPSLPDTSNDKDSTDGTMEVEDDDCTITTAETPEPPVDLDEALGELDQIDSYTKNILNDDEEVKSDKKAGSKRGISESDESSQDIKKPKLDTDTDENKEDATNADDSEADKAKLMKAMKKSVKKQTKKLTRSELENILSVKMVEMMTNKSEMGKLRQQCDSYRDIMEKWKKRAEALRKQCADLSTVMRKYIVDTKNKPKEKVRPVLITRSVGLQVMSAEQRRAQHLGMGRGGTLMRKGPGRPPGSSNPLKPAVSGAAGSSPRVVPKLAQNGVVRNGGPSPVRSTAETATSSRPSPVVSTPQSSRPNWQMGNTTIMITSPSKGATPPVQQAPVTAQAATTPVTQSSSSSSQGTVATTATKTIDVVDIDSDDEEKVEPAPPPPPQRPIHTVQRGMTRGGFAGRGRGGHQFIMTKDDKLVPLQPQQQIIRQQNQPRMMGQGGMRPMMMGRARPSVPRPMTHPAPLPALPKLQPSSPGWKSSPPRPSLKISRVANGIVLSWNMQINLSSNATITSYQLYAYQESNQQRPDPNLWKKVGDVKALPLPMACTLTQFTRGNKYHFAVRAMDLHQRVGNFSDPSSIFLN